MGVRFITIILLTIFCSWKGATGQAQIRGGSVRDQVSAAYIEFNSGRLDEAKELLLSIPAQAAKDSIMYLRLNLLSHIYYLNGNYDALMHVIHEADAFPRAPESLRIPVQYLKSCMFYKRGMYDSAFMVCKSVLYQVQHSRAPMADSIFLASLYANYAYFSLLPGIELASESKLNIVNSYLDRSIQILNGRDGDSTILAYPYLYRALAYSVLKQDTTLVRHNLANVINLYSKTIRDDEFNNTTGYLLYSLKYYDDIIHLFSNDSDSPWLGLSLIENGEWKEGKAIIEKYLNGPDQNSYTSCITHLVLAQKLYESDPQQASIHFKKGIELRNTLHRANGAQYISVLDSGDRLYSQIHEAMSRMQKNDDDTSFKMYVILIGSFLLIIGITIALVAYIRGRR